MGNKKEFGVFSNYKETLDADEEELVEQDVSLDDLIQSDLDSIQVPISPELVGAFENNLFFDATTDGDYAGYDQVFGHNQVFENYQQEFHALFLYYLYTNKLIGALAESYKMIKANIDRSDSDASWVTMAMIDEASSTYEDDLSELSNQSILLMLYSSFEKFLVELADDIAQNEGIEFLKGLYAGSMVEKYLKYLRVTVGMNCHIPDTTMNIFRAINKTRNYYTHKTSYSKLVEDVRKIAPKLVINDQIPLNHSLIITMFKSIAEMVKIIIKAYWERYQTVHKN